MQAMAERETAEALSPPIQMGDAIGMMEYRDFRNGRIYRWTVCRGDRTNNFSIRHPDGRQSKPHGMAWLLDRIRPVILGFRQTPRGEN